MKQAIIIFIALLVMLMMISVFGGSLRFDPPQPQPFHTPFRFEPYEDVPPVIVPPPQDEEKKKDPTDTTDTSDTSAQASASPAVEAFTSCSFASF
jgi:hypothetical protein